PLPSKKLDRKRPRMGRTRNTDKSSRGPASSRYRFRLRPARFPESATLDIEKVVTEKRDAGLPGREARTAGMRRDDLAGGLVELFQQGSTHFRDFGPVDRLDLLAAFTVADHICGDSRIELDIGAWRVTEEFHHGADCFVRH